MTDSAVEKAPSRSTVYRRNKKSERERVKKSAKERAIRAVSAGVVKTRPAVGWLDTYRTIVPPIDYQRSWRVLDLDRNTLDSISTDGITELLANLSPDVSRAIWDTLRMMDPGHRIECFTIDPDGQPSNKQDIAAQRVLDEFLAQIAEKNGSFSVVTSRLSMGAFLRGAFFAELVLDAGGNLPIDIVVPDPISVRFRHQVNEKTGEVWEIGQWQKREWVSLDYPSIVYIPIDPMVGSPYGRAPVTPAIFPSLFLLSVIHDLKRVIAQQGYMRVDIKIIVDRIKEALAIESVDELNAAIEDLTESVGTAWANQEPDDSYVHPDYIDVDANKGAMEMSGGGIGGADSLIAALERMLVRALKSMPIVMGSTEGVSEANANRQWEMYVASIRSLQKGAKTLLEKLLQLSLQVQGVQAAVVVTFDEVRASEAYRDAQTDLVKVSVAQQSEDRGYIDHDEAARYVTGHEATGEVSAVDDALPATPNSDNADGESESRMIKKENV